MLLISYFMHLIGCKFYLVKSSILKIIAKKMKKNVHKLDLNIKSTYLCRNKNEKKQ